MFLKRLKSKSCEPGKSPVLSLIVIVYNMKEQAKKTLHSLSAQYQYGVDPNTYEVVVVENKSNNNLDKSDVEQFGKQFRYFLREEKSQSPVSAISFGTDQARGQYIGVMIDGARMVTPGVVGNILKATKLSNNVVISLPGYHLGATLQQESVASGYDSRAEIELLQSINWPADGYRLFEISTLSASCGAGLLKPFSESNCLVMSQKLFNELNGFDTRFKSKGGGLVNLDIYRRACELQGVELIELIGEGSFHQFHGGVTTNLPMASEERIKLMEAMMLEYQNIRGVPFTKPTLKPFLLGKVPEGAERFIFPAKNNA